MSILLTILFVFIVDVIGCVIAREMTLPFKNIYWFPMGGWIALWQNRAKGASDA